MINESGKYKKKTGKELCLNTEPCISLLLAVNEKKKKNILTKLKQYATDRQYLSSMMKKYAGMNEWNQRIRENINKDELFW